MFVKDSDTSFRTSFHKTLKSCNSEATHDVRNILSGIMANTQRSLQNIQLRERANFKVLHRYDSIASKSLHRCKTEGVKFSVLFL